MSSCPLGPAGVTRASTASPPLLSPSCTALSLKKALKGINRQAVVINKKLHADGVERFSQPWIGTCVVLRRRK